jgi:voltage-gated potassium channel Kch
MLVPILGTFGLLVLSHTVQVWIWAIVLIWLEALPNLFEAIYFSLVTYTTLGYGDVVLSDNHKIFGAMASVTGLLNFGVSTAFLVAILGKILPNHLGGE